MAQVVVGQIPSTVTNSQVPTDEGGYVDESYFTRRFGTRPPPVQQFNGNNNSTRGQQQGQEEAEDALSDVSDFDEDWEELVQQMQQILVAFLLPWLGRWLGRKFSFWAWTRFVEWYYYPRTTDKAKIELTSKTSITIN